MSRIRSLVRMLRSRTLAILLLAAVSLYSIAGTLVPQEGVATADSLRSWAHAHPLAEALAGAFSLHTAFSSPIFLVLCGFLALTTAFCAFERSRRALRVARGLLAPPSAAARGRLLEHPDATVTVSGDTTIARIAERVSAGVSRRGLRTRTTDGLLVDGRGGVLGLAGSPIFHWSLVLLMCVIALGQLTRAEGFLALTLDTRVADTHESYLQLAESPWFGERHSGIEFEMTEMDRDHTIGRTDFGPSPYVHAYRDGQEVRAGWVHANQPLRIGSLMLHMVALGPSVTVAIESAIGAEVARETMTIDTSEETTTGTIPVVFDLTDDAGSSAVAVQLQVLNKLSAGAVPGVAQAIVATGTADATTFGTPVTLGVGDAISLPGGQRLRIVEIGDWARVSLANDWSVSWIYALLMLAIAGLAVALLVPAKRVTVLVVQDDDGARLHIAAWHDKRDPLFAEQAIEAIAAAVNEPEV